MDARHDRYVLSDPHVVSHNGVAFERKVFECGRGFFPAAAHDVERIRRDAFHPVVRAVHHEFDSLCNRAELSDDEPVAEKFVVVRHVLFKTFGIFRVIVIRVVAHGDVFARDDIFDVAYARNFFVRVNGCGIWANHILSFWELEILQN